jgi:protein tyrosine phosphatase (PTP) superfamily phosphohydrolase (DUF442 family)
MRRMPCSSALALALALPLAGCSSTDTKPDPAPTSANEAADAPVRDAPDSLPNEGQAWNGLVTGGQPSEADLQAARDRGFKVVVNARVPGETGSLENERAIVEGLGMTYYEIPLEKNPDALTAEQAGALARVIADHGSEGVFLHCGSGNRASSLLAYYLATDGGLSADEALAIGKAAGITGWEKAMTQKLQSLATGTEVGNGETAE